MIFRGGKGDTTEGGIRVDAFIRWPSMIVGDANLNSTIHVSDLYTTLARFAGAWGGIPRDRLADRVDQTATVVFNAEQKSRRIIGIVYSVRKSEALTKDQLKLNLPGAGESAILADFFDLFRDTHEKYPVSTEAGAWGGEEFVCIPERHMARKQKYPDRESAEGVHYEGIENLRPETRAAVEAFLIKRA